MPATIYSYNPGLGTIPDAQGWIREQNPPPQGPTAVISNGVFHTFRQPLPKYEYWHKESVALDFATGSYILESELRIISSNYINNGSSQRSGYYLWAVDSVGHSFAVGIDGAGIAINTDGNFIPGRGVPRTPFNTTDAFHTYRFVIDGARGTLFIDGNQFASASLGGTTGLDFVDPNNRNRVMFGDASGVGESESELRSLSFGIPDQVDLVVTSLAWNAAQGGADLSYSISGADLTQATTVGLYWSADTTFDPNQDTLIPGSVTTTQTAQGSYTGHVAPSLLTVPPAGARYLLAGIDPDNTVIETDEGNNVASWRSNLGGLAWLQAEGVSQQDGQGKYPNSQQVSDLDPAFRSNVEAFIAALNEAGASVHISSTRRDVNRAYLMHYAWNVSHGIVAPAAVPARAGIDIQWNYGDDSLSRQAAQQMVDFFGMTNAAALDSRHIQGLAIDMQVSWTGVLNIRNKARRVVPITSGLRNADNIGLARVAATYGVFRNFSDNAPHWSSDGR